MSTYFLSYFKDYALNHVKTYQTLALNSQELNSVQSSTLNSLTQNSLNQSNLTQNNSKSVSYVNFILNYEPNIMLMQKIYDFMIGVKICHTENYARLVNLCEEDLDKYLLNSKCYMAYIKGNNDDSEIYSIGGRKLYDKMLDINPFKRGYEFIKQILGSTEDLEIIKEMTSQFSDPTTISVLSGSTSPDTVTDIVNQYANQVKSKQPDILQNYDISVDDTTNELKIQHKVMTYWTIYDYISVLKHAYGQISGSYIGEVFVSRELTPNGPKEPAMNKIGNVPIIIQEANTDVYMMPRYKYVSEWYQARLNFVNPEGMKLIEFDIDNHNMTVFLFTKTDLKSVYDHIIDMN
jgi:hypothetical protein